MSRPQREGPAGLTSDGPSSFASGGRSINTSTTVGTSSLLTGSDIERLTR